MQKQSQLIGRKIMFKYLKILRGRLDFNEVLVALLLTCNSITMIVGEVSGSVVAVIWGSFFLLFINNFQVYFGGSYRKRYVFIALIGFILFVNCLILNNPTTKDYATKFIVFGLPFILIPYNRIRLDNVVALVFYLGLVYLPLYLTYDYGVTIMETGEYDAGTLMTFSYRILIFFFCSILVAIVYSKCSLERIVAIISCILYLALIAVIGSRGAILSVLVFLVILFIRNGDTVKVKNRRLLITIIVLFVLYVGFMPFIEFIYDFCVAHDLNFLSLDRLYAKVVLESSSLSSGRDNLADIAIDNFLSSPLWGNGIGSFDNFSGFYPHNVFLQFLQEGGLLLFIPFLILFFRGVKILLYSRSIVDLWMVVIFCSGVMQLFFSYYFWASQYFWTFISLIICYTQLKNISNSNKIKTLL